MDPQVLTWVTVGMLLEVAVVVAMAVWAVGKIRGTTAALGTEINGLSLTIGTLRKSIDRLDDRQYEQAQQIAKLEAATAGTWRSDARKGESHGN